MASSLSSSMVSSSPRLQIPFKNKRPNISSLIPPFQRARFALVKCEATPSSGGEKSSLRIGSPVIIVEAPGTLKTADSMPSLRVNSGEVKAGDVGRIVARKPKDVWAVRLKIGTYLLDGKHFRSLNLEE
ncbi:protein CHLORORESPIRATORY REDUCTION 42, chloroplastic [Aristolochia californica]|uniref:protein CHLORORESPIRATORY REDUCTION 42, chloroplastic n=1 Tax=Aristolochia californica TaxID=171875 RepID=UPI0035D8FC6F